MKKILLSVLVLWATGAYSQEIRMPDEKRKEYVKEERKASNSTSVRQSESTDQMTEEERRREALEARKKAAAAAKNESLGGTMVYCIIEEQQSLDGAKTKINILSDPMVEKQLSGTDIKVQKKLSIAMQKRQFKNGLEALNYFSMNGWTLTHSSSYVNPGNEMIIHSYLMGYSIP